MQTGIFSHLHPHHCVRVPANSRTFNLNFQDFPGPKCLTARMSKINNDGLDQYGTGPFEQQQFGTAGVEGVNSFSNKLSNVAAEQWLTKAWWWPSSHRTRPAHWWWGIRRGVQDNDDWVARWGSWHTDSPCWLCWSLASQTLCTDCQWSLHCTYYTPTPTTYHRLRLRPMSHLQFSCTSVQQSRAIKLHALRLSSCMLRLCRINMA